MNEEESEVDVDEPMRLGGRPLNGKNNYSQDKINIAKVSVVQQGTRRKHTWDNHDSDDLDKQKGIYRR